MASELAIAKMCHAALERIEAWAREHVSEGLTPIPRNMRDTNLLRKTQLETIADWLDRAVITSTGVIEPEPDVLAQARNLVESGNWTKAQMEAVLTGAEPDGDSSADS